MNYPEAIRILNSAELQIKGAIIKQHQYIYDMCQEGIALLLEAHEIIGAYEFSDDQIKPEHIGRFIGVRYLITIPFKGRWCIEALVNGYPSIAFILIRSLFEEVVSLEYYSRNYHLAIQATKDQSYNEPNFETKLRNVGIKQNHPLHRLYSDLSNDYVHPKLLMSAIIIEKDTLTPEPLYIFENVEKTLNFLLFMLGAPIEKCLQELLELNKNLRWKKNATKYLKKSKEMFIEKGG